MNCSGNLISCAGTEDANATRRREMRDFLTPPLHARSQGDYRNDKDTADEPMATLSYFGKGARVKKNLKRRRKSFFGRIFR